MATLHTSLPPMPMLITPECGAPGCSVVGDQYTMVRSRGCDHWFCPDHLAADEGATLVRLDRPALRGLAYYQGSCVPCRQARRRIPPPSH
jgi:hypothetical protein